VRRRDKAAARRAFKDLTKDNPNHTEALYLAAAVLGDRQAGEQLAAMAPGNRWAIKLRLE
jgi:uncharacterized protein HemY